MSLISQVQDVFPELTERFIAQCLRTFQNNYERVINEILEETLPANLLRQLHAIRSGEAEEPEVEEEEELDGAGGGSGNGTTTTTTTTTTNTNFLSEVLWEAGSNSRYISIFLKASFNSNSLL